MRHLTELLYQDLPHTCRLASSALRVAARRLSPNRLDGRPVVVFHERCAKHRVANQSRALRASGKFQTVLFTREFHLEEQDPSFDDIRVSFSAAHFARQVAALARAFPVHSVVCSSTDLTYARELLAAPRSWPLLVSAYDSYWAERYFQETPDDFSTILHPRMIGLEQEVFPECDGVISRFRDVGILFEELGVPTPILERWDLCDPAHFQPLRTRDAASADEWHVVTAGLVFPMSAPRAARSESQMVRYAPAFRQERVHLHVYPSPHFRFHCPEYEREDRENPYFHLHPSVSPHVAAEVLSGYDFGWLAYDFSENRMCGERYIREILPLRVFGYLEAGLPILCTESQEAIARIVRTYGCGLVLPQPTALGLRELLRECDHAELRRNVGRAREALISENHADALVRFLEEARERRLRKDERRSMGTGG